MNKAHVTHPELKATFSLDILGVKKNPNGAMYSSLGVITKGTIIEVNVSELGLVTPGGKVVWGKYAQVRHGGGLWLQQCRLCCKCCVFATCRIYLYAAHLCMIAVGSLYFIVGAVGAQSQLDSSWGCMLMPIMYVAAAVYVCATIEFYF